MPKRGFEKPRPRSLTRDGSGWRAGGGRCEVCDEHFTSPQALHMHMVKQHGARAPAASYTDASHACWHCGLQTPGRSRLLQHYRQGLLRKGSGSCLAQLALNGVSQISDADIKRPEEEDRAGRLAMRRKGRPGHASDVWSLVPKAAVCRPVTAGPLPKVWFGSPMAAANAARLRLEEVARIVQSRCAGQGGGEVNEKRGEVTSTKCPGAFVNGGSKIAIDRVAGAPVAGQVDLLVTQGSARWSATMCKHLGAFADSEGAVDKRAGAFVDG
eukprot:TRINITY_DN36630_c0_g2_i1.p1 TRINITY_DN36630_c0_g2~~TRINITY_DN36630_c0_g2_i1.p1  ORF type:complete len:270 (-),score=31.40 TRINITY_DN36630_c0_g2_i1:224-1033(-)